MAGSLVEYNYVLDLDFAVPANSPGITIFCDESNQRGIGIAPPGIQISSPPNSVIVDRIEPRYIYWEGLNADGEKIRRKIVVTRPDNSYYLRGGALTIEAYPGVPILGVVTGSVGEKKRFRRSVVLNPDTGITDGSQP